MLPRSLRVPARIFQRSQCPLRPASGLHGLRTLSAESETFGRWGERRTRLFASVSTQRQEAAVLIETADVLDDAPPPEMGAHMRAKSLPVSCPGCGALSQTIDAETAGFYGPKREARTVENDSRRRAEELVFQHALARGALPSEHMEVESSANQSPQSPDVPICDRCHYLRYQSRGTGIIHPSMQSIQDIIEESPHKNNHIYHVIDAADFPMSLIPNLVTALQLPRLRTQNRRSKSMQYIRGRMAEVSFIITRSDLLAPKKEQVDALVPYLREVLRDSLGRSGRNVRLGNVRCVSANRGWWTKTVKEDIWRRGGAGWMVGKVNVGKSALYEVVFPKGRNHEDIDVEKLRRQEQQKALQSVVAKAETHNTKSYVPMGRDVSILSPTFADSTGDLGESSPEATPQDPESFQETALEAKGWNQNVDEDEVLFDEGEDGSLLPPAQPETAYPNMPLVSSLPGTTASPIRIPFGNGKGELIDLPGIQRSSLETHVKPDHRKHLLMKNRVVPEQHTIKPGQSILIGGLIRITPKTEDLIFLVYPFVPLQAHVTGNEKAIAIQTGIFPTGETYSGTIESIATDAAKDAMKLAGTFRLSWDVTKRRTGALTDKAAGKQKAANLPFIVYSADIIIEGVGWVELTCQVRSRRTSFISETVMDAFGEGAVRKEVPTVPEVEVWTPEGKHVSMRRPMNAWTFGGPKKVPVHLRRMRPRQSINFQKRKAGGALGGRKQVVEGE